VSESRGDGEPGTSGQPKSNSSQPGSGGQSGNWSQAVDPVSSRTNGQSGSGQSRRAGDPVADFQRWLMRAGARSMANQVADQVKRTLGQERRAYGNVWDQATNEPPPDEPPECQWCPVCQAARAARTGGPGLMASLADAGGALASMAQDAFSSLEQIMKTQEQNRSQGGSGGTGGRPSGPPQ
jgi:hypothetical protein